MAGEAQDRGVEDILLFYREAGVDAALDEEPVDWFARAAAERERRARQAAESRKAKDSGEPVSDPEEGRAPREVQAARPEPAGSAAPGVIAPSQAVVMAARERAAGAPSLDSLRETLESFEGCNLRFTATNLVFADGEPGARVMFVGEAPGFEEDLQGLPFVGRSGRLLDRMLAAIGLDRTSAYIANVIPWRPPGNRTPTPQETEICRPFIRRQIELCDPEVLVMLGGASAKQLLATNEGILRLSGTWRDYSTGTRTIRAMATLHPAYLLRQPLQKRLAWRDLMAVRAALDGTGPTA